MQLRKGRNLCSRRSTRPWPKMDTVAQPPAAAPSPNPLGGINGSPISSPANGGNYAIPQTQYPTPQMVQPSYYQQQAPGGYSTPTRSAGVPSSKHDSGFQPTATSIPRRFFRIRHSARWNGQLVPRRKPHQPPGTNGVRIHVSGARIGRTPGPLRERSIR